MQYRTRKTSQGLILLTFSTNSATLLKKCKKLPTIVYKIYTGTVRKTIFFTNDEQ